MSSYAQQLFFAPGAHWSQHAPELKSIEIILDSRKICDQLYESRELWVGAVGGPICTGFFTPSRNAMTLSAKDVRLSYFNLYRKTFADGFLRGWRGGLFPTFTAVPCFTCIGPGYLAAYKATGIAPLACFIAATVESSLSFAAQRRNAIIAYNATRRGVWQRIPVGFKAFAPGFWCHVGRNATAMAGIRCISPPLQEIFSQTRMRKEHSYITADFLSSCIAAAISMPFNHVFSWATCTPQLERLTLAEKTKASANFLVTTYKEQGVKLLSRDLAVRMSYTGPLYTAYRIIERRVLA